jgi:hypothetical protein
MTTEILKGKLADALLIARIARIAKHRRDLRPVAPAAFQLSLFGASGTFGNSHFPQDLSSDRDPSLRFGVSEKANLWA